MSNSLLAGLLPITPEAKPEADPSMVGPLAGLTPPPPPRVPPVAMGAPGPDGGDLGYGGGYDDDAPDDLGLFAPPKADDVYDVLQDKPHLAWLFDSLATKTSANAKIEQMGNMALQGVKLDRQNKMAEEEALRKRAAEFIQRTADLPDDQYRAAVARLRAAASNPPTLEQPGLRQPGWASVALSVLGAALDPRHGAQALAAPWLAAQGVREQDLALARQRYQADLQAQDAAVQAGKIDVDFEAGNLDRERRGLLDQAGLATSQADDLERDVARDEDRADRIDYRNDQAADRAEARRERREAQLRDDFRMAKSLPEMERIGRELGYSPEQIQAHFHESQRKAVGAAKAQFSRETLGFLNAFGEIPDALAKQLGEQRDAIAADYGIDPKELPPVPTGQTLRKQFQTRRAQEFERTFGQRAARDATNLTSKLASLDLARQRLRWAIEHGGVMEQIAAGGLDVARGNLAIRQYQSSLKDAQGEQRTKLETIRLKLIDVQRKMGEARKNGDEKKLRELAAEEAGLAAQKEYVVGLLPAEEQDAEIANVLNQAAQATQAATGIDLTGPLGSVAQPLSPQPPAGLQTRAVAPIRYAGGNKGLKIKGHPVADLIADANDKIAKGQDRQKVIDALKALGVTAQ